ncbi:DUF1800 domain-containing protein [Flaviaesturariibacter flavus]|uniref:DUF1800 domain-containing protein n=1 Tax=Flaviaesturariibacter flavus TaxID=2502780 RepID=A0A4R1BAQ7_9BACT|nr:DUF1800 domain-containing protein [Flaviaesturariibacter flavus]TCJ14066.1 DUF1800 domain-containing protein [Flaviaesturariibacter flavus]
MPLTLQQKNQHLLWRAAFGPNAGSLDALGHTKTQDLYASLRQASEKRPAYIDVVDDALKGLMAGLGDAGAKAGDAETKRMLRERSREGIRSLNLTWLYQIIDSEAQLREKMAFFWHGHFATRNLNVFYQQDLLDILRVNALGSFRELLHAVSKSAAMLNFLNAQQNKKDHPNENFAREVMELFTLGRGNYTEHDIKEAARAFTGWSANFRGEFQFRRFQHDSDSKTVLGKTGNLTGEDVLDHLLAQKQTARFITRKIYRFFVNEEVDEKKAEWLSERFYKNDYAIGKLMDDIFTSDWFYDPKNVGAKIKSPIELIAGMQRVLPMKLENEETLLLAQRVLGQQLFYPPNVAGWPGGRSWIDSSTLMFRMRMPMLLNDQDDLNVRPKTDDDTAGGKMEALPAAMRNGGRVINAQIDWMRYTRNFDGVAREQLFSSIAGSLLQVPLQVPAATVSAFADSSARDSFVKSATLRVMSLPEYQMC